MNKIFLLSLCAALLFLASCENRHATNAYDESYVRRKKMISSKESMPMTAAEKANVSDQKFSEEERAEFYDKTEAEELIGNTEEYSLIVDNTFLESTTEPLSTFSIDVDNASYTNSRRFIQSGMLPPKDAVRIEEFVNYFHYDYAQPTGEDPFSVNTELTACPWNPENQLVMIGLQGKDIDPQAAPASNLVFLVDVSGSMEQENKLPLVRESLSKLLKGLGENDRVALVVYAGNAGVVLNSTSCNEKGKIEDAIAQLTAGGSTNGAGGIIKAYEIAQENLLKEGNNRVILCTDGDFNVGMSSDSELVRLIEEKRKSGVFLTVCGFGMGNYKDSKMEQLADNGNGAYFYIDNEREAERIFVQGLRSTMFTIAKDVKIQVEFNPLYVESYRLIGYENRRLENPDFENDSIDAGEIGAGHTVTALYEIKPSHGQLGASTLRYQNTITSDKARTSGDVLTVSLRYKKPKEETSKLISSVVKKEQYSNYMSDNLKWAGAVASFCMVLRDSPFKGTSTIESVKTMAMKVSTTFMDEYKQEFLTLVDKSDKALLTKK